MVLENTTITKIIAYKRFNALKELRSAEHNQTQTMTQVWQGGWLASANQ